MNLDLCLDSSVEFRLRDLDNGKMYADREIFYLTESHNYELVLSYYIHLAAGVDKTRLRLFVPTDSLHSIPLSEDRLLYLYIDFYNSSSYVIKGERAMRAEFMPCYIQMTEPIQLRNRAYPDRCTLPEQIFTEGIPVQSLGGLEKGEIIINFYTAPVIQEKQKTTYIICGAIIVMFVICLLGARHGYKKLKKEINEEAWSNQD